MTRTQPHNRAIVTVRGNIVPGLNCDSTTESSARTKSFKHSLRVRTDRNYLCSKTYLGRLDEQH